MSEIAIKIENLRKKYRLGAIGGQSLNAELQSWWARKRGKEDPNLMIGQDYSNFGDSFYALDGINLEVKKGEALGIIGGNGAGKSTLLKILSRVTAPTEGDIWIDGRIASMLEVGTGFHPEMTGRENIYMNGAILGMTKKEVDEKIESIIDFSECRQFIDTPVKRYSSGMYVKLAFAVASHLDAEIMIMDEVLAVGDMKFQKKCLGKMDDEAKGGKTVLYVSHNMATIRNLCTRCIVLDKGKVIFDGDVEKAIDLYLGENDLLEESYYLLDDCYRENYDYGKKFRFHDFDFIDKDIPIYFENDKIRFKVSFVSTDELENVRLFLHLYNQDVHSVVSLVMSEVFKVHTGNQCISLEFDVSVLANGNYAFEIGAMQSLLDGNHITLDRPRCGMKFRIDKSSKTVLWNSKIYGSIIMPEIKVLND